MVKIKTCKIVPKFSLPDLLKLRRVEYPCIMELNEKEIIRAMNYAHVYEVLEDGTEISLNVDNFNKNNNILPTPSPEDPDQPSVQNPSNTKVIGLENVYVDDIPSVSGGGISKARIY